MKQSQILTNHYLKPLLKYLCDNGHITIWMKSQIKTSHSRKADKSHDKSARSFCFVILGERIIHYASSITALPPKAVTGILLHEIAHMIIEENGGDPELGVDEWVLDNVPESGYEYLDVKYEDFDGERKIAKNIECVSNKFLKTIGV